MKKMRQQFADTMVEVGVRDLNLVVLIGDISHFILQPFAKACPGRFYNVGICEPTIVSMAAGLAKTGFYPVVHTIAPFIIERAFEQIKLDFCYQNLPGNLITVGSAFDYSNLGCTHHCYDDFALLKSLPNTQILYPASPKEFDILFKETYSNNQLTLFRLPEYQHGQVIDSDLIRCGKAVKITEGDDLTVVVIGPQLKNVIDVQKQLMDEDFEVEIIYLHTISPLDIKSIRSSVEKTRKILVVEEHNRVGGIGHDILQHIYDIKDLRFHSMAIESFIHEYGTYDDLCAKIGLNSEGIYKAVREVFCKK